MHPWRDLSAGLYSMHQPRPTYLVIQLDEPITYQNQRLVLQTQHLSHRIREACP